MAIRCVIGAPRAQTRRRTDRPRPAAVLAGLLCVLALAGLSLVWNLWLSPGRGHYVRAGDRAMAREFERAAPHRADVVRRPPAGSPDAPDH